MDQYSDKEIDSLFDEQAAIYQQVGGQQHGADAPVVHQQGAPVAQQEYPPPLPSVPLYPIGMANTPPAANGGQQNAIMGMVTKQVGPLPLWAWALIGSGVAGTAYFYTKKGDAPKKNGSDGSDDESSSKSSGMLSNLMSAMSPREDSSGGSSSSWSASRSGFAEKLEKYLRNKGKLQHGKVWVDADDAHSGGMKTVSPLVNIEVRDAKALKMDTALQRWARREGLNPVQHEDGSIGFYPHSSKRGKEWEQYIDALRDEGQRV